MVVGIDALCQLEENLLKIILKVLEFILSVKIARCVENLSCAHTQAIRSNPRISEMNFQENRN